MRKFYVFVVIFGFYSVSSFAVTVKEATQVKNQIQSVMFNLKGVNFLGITQCLLGTDVVPAHPSLPPMEACIDLGFETKENMLNAQKIFVSPLRIDGVFVHFMTMGRVVPE